MDTKLTIFLNKEVIEQAREYARKQNTSLPKLIEEYLKKVSYWERKSTEISPLVKSLSGVLSLPKSFDTKRDYSKHLAAKYQAT